MSARFLLQREQGERPLVLGHRGAPGACPENTILSFREAMRQGADGVELDVMRCRSGEVVVVHDDDLVRVSGGAPGSEAKVRETSLVELRRFDLGQGQRVPTLDEVLEEVGKEALVNVELKSREVKGRQHLRLLRDDGLAEAVGAVLRRAGRLPAKGAAEGTTLVSSFDPLQVLRFGRHEDGTLPLGLLFHAELALPLREAWPAALLRPAALHPDAALVDAVSMRRWRKGGYAVHVWTVDDPREARALAALGVDGIITNRPGELLSALDHSVLPPLPSPASGRG